MFLSFYCITNRTDASLRQTVFDTNSEQSKEHVTLDSLRCLNSMPLALRTVQTPKYQAWRALACTYIIIIFKLKAVVVFCLYASSHTSNSVLPSGNSSRCFGAPFFLSLLSQNWSTLRQRNVQNPVAILQFFKMTVYMRNQSHLNNWQRIWAQDWYMVKIILLPTYNTDNTFSSSKVKSGKI